MSDRFVIGEFLDEYVVTAIRGLKDKQGRMLSVLSLTPLAACGGGGGGDEAVAVAVVVPPDPDYSEGPTGTFTGKDDTDLILSQNSATTNLIVLSKGGNDTISTGFGNDVIRGGLGADTIDAGGGNDVILIVGSTGAGEYTNADITNAGGTGLDLSSLLSLATLNDQPISEGAAGEIIDGGSGTNTLVIYGDVDLTGLTLSNVTTLVVNSVVTLTPAQLEQFTTVNGDGQSVINIVDDPDDDTIYNIDLSVLDLSGIASISTSGGVQITLSSLDDLDGIGSITGDGNLQVTIVDGGSGTVTAGQVSAMISGTASIEAETPAVSIDDITANEEEGTATFSVTLSAASSQSVTVGYTAPDGTSGTLTFAPSETSKLFSTAWVDDSLDEANETQTATLSSPTNATIADGSGSLTIIDDDASPVLTSAATVSIEENTTSVLTVTAIDAAGDILSYAISGTDASLFDIDAVSGAVAFKAAPDFESPGDSGGNNVYDISVAASDGVNSTSQDIAMMVTNGNDSPTGFATISGTAGEGQTLTATNTLSDQDGMGAVSYQWQRDGVDISGATGSVYTLTSADIGPAIKVIVSYTDGLGNAGSVSSAAVTAGLASSFKLSALDGSNGFVLNGIDALDRSGRSVSDAGDVNGDGFDDVIIGVPFASPNGSESGETYVVYGSAGGFGATFELSSLAEGDGSAGFVLNGINVNDKSGAVVSGAGDVNGDGYDDVIIGARFADSNGLDSGESYVVFGSAGGFGATLELSSLAEGDGSIGFVLNSIDTGDWSGSVSGAGDINDDGYDDLIVGAPHADPNGFDSGESYVIYGSASGFGATFDLSSLEAGDGSTGFVLNGIATRDYSGFSVSGAGDINGDGYDDLIIGAWAAAPDGRIGAGESYVVYGSASGFGATFDLSSLEAGDGSTGFVLNGIDDLDWSGYSVSGAGDVNGDGYDDLIIGATDADPNGENSGESYVIYGSAGGFGASLDLSSLAGGDGSTGSVLNGIDRHDYSGFSVSGAGDVNGDGYDDLIIGAWQASPNGGNSGESYVVFGSANGFGATLELSSLLSENGGDGSTGFVLNGIAASEFSGSSVSGAGDVNGDGYDDLTVGAWGASPNGNAAAGETYVVYGAATPAISIDDITANEVDEADTFTVSLSTASGKPVTVDYTAPDGTSGTLTFAPGETSKTFTTAWTDDSLDEANETQTAALGNPGNATIADGSGNLTITDDDASPVIISSAIASVEEGTTSVLTVTATDADGQTPTYAISGTDAGLFSLDGASGIVEFKTGPDFESPADAGGDNVYDITLIASDGVNGTSQNVAITVTDGNDSPTGSVTISGTATNGETLTATNTLSDQDGMGTITYQWQRDGADMSGATDATYALILGDMGAGITVVANYTDGLGNAESVSSAAVTASLASSLELSTLDGTNGFVLNGISVDERSGHSVSNAGDINGDGYDDLIIGTFGLGQLAGFAGESYVVYGGTGVDGTDGAMDLSALDGSSGFALLGIPGIDDNLIHTVSSAGDINGDGYDDLIVGSKYADPVSYIFYETGSYFANAGESYIIYGGASVDGGDGIINLSAVNGAAGFVLNGVSPGDNSGISVSDAGDFNGDGYDDLIIGAHYADPNGLSSGASYVVYGGPGIDGGDGTLDLSSLDGTSGFVLNGIDPDDRSGTSVSSAGDVNGDGYDDLIIGARYADPNGNENSSESYVVYGGVDVDGGDGVMDLSALDGTTGFVLNGINAGDYSGGHSVSGVGDVNGDGYDDLIIGAWGADPSGNAVAGESYVVYGGANIDGGDGVMDLSALSGTNGFVLNGIDTNDRSGWSVSSAGDVNGDGYDDLIIGAWGADPNGNRYAGESYVVYGGTNIDGGDGVMDLSALDGTTGFVVYGIDVEDFSGRSVSGAGDLNNDGYDDLIIGAPQADPNGGDSGESYVIYGFATSLDVHMGTNGNDVMTGSANDERIIGREGDDTITSGSGYDVLVFDGDFGDDIVTDYTQGMDLFDFSDSEIIDDISDLTISIVNGDTVLDDGLGNTITLTGFTGTLTNGDFDFV